MAAERTWSSAPPWPGWLKWISDPRRLALVSGGFAASERQAGKRQCEDRMACPTRNLSFRHVCAPRQAFDGPFMVRPQVRREYPLSLSISISGGKETYEDSPSNGERTGSSPA